MSDNIIVSTSDIMNREAYIFAFAAHAAINQRRKYTGKPYIVHPIEVAAIVASVESHTPEMIAAAYLHDVVEDTEITIDMIHDTFGPIVAGHVDGLTDISKPSDGNRLMRKSLDRDHTHIQSFQTQTIKVADLIGNTCNIAGYDSQFARVYLREKRLLLQGMTADENLIAQAWVILDDYEEIQIP